MSLELNLLVCGDRNWTDWFTMHKKLAFWSHIPVLLIEGKAKGADIMAGQIGNGFGWTVLEIPADWDLHGKSAGPIRNRQMLDMMTPGPNAHVIGFHRAIWNSKGTLDCLREAARRGFTVELVQ